MVANPFRPPAPPPSPISSKWRLYAVSLALMTVRRGVRRPFYNRRGRWLSGACSKAPTEITGSRPSLSGDERGSVPGGGGVGGPGSDGCRPADSNRSDTGQGRSRPPGTHGPSWMVIVWHLDGNGNGNRPLGHRAALVITIMTNINTLETGLLYETAAAEHGSGEARGWTTPLGDGASAMREDEFYGRGVDAREQAPRSL
jgi:hypothetical protein